MMFSCVEHDCPTVETTGKRFQVVADFYSVFFNTIGINAREGVLTELLKSEALAKAVPKLLPIDISAAQNCTALNRYEFEGSLVGALVQGTCTEQVVCDEREAFEIARAMMREAVLRPNSDIVAFRMDDPKWSAITNQATLSWAYFVFESSRNVCWFLCFADQY